MYASLDEFSVAIARLGELRDSGQLQARVSPEWGVSLKIDRGAEDVPEHGGGLYLDIHDVLDAIARGVSVEEFVAGRTWAPADSPPAEEESVSRAKYAAAAAVFPPSSLKPGLRQRLGAALKAFLVRAVIRISGRSSRLGPLMKLYPFRRVLGPSGRRLAWQALGAQIADTAYIGPRVWMRIPRRVSVGAGTKLAGRIMIESYGHVSIGRNVLMNNTDVFSTEHDIDDPHFKGHRQSVSIGDYAWIPHKVIILPGVRIGSHAVIGTGSVVSRDVPDYGVADGNPATVIKERARIPYTYVPSSVYRAPMIE